MSGPGRQESGHTPAVPVRPRELLLNLPFIAALVWLAAFVQDHFSDATTKLGLDWFLTAFSGQGGAADIAWEVAAARGWLDPAFSTYDPLTTLGPLIGMNWAEDQAHSHPPFSIPMYSPLAALDYQVWLPWWMAVMISAIAISMRLMKVPPHLAYPLALAISATAPGRWALESSYPLAALLLALAWSYRHRPVVGGVTMGLLASMRGTALLLFLYPVIRRRWRVVAWAVGTVALLTLVAIAVEPGIVAGFLDGGRASVEQSLALDNQWTPQAILQRNEWPVVLWWLAVLVAAAIAARRGQHPFWVLTWLSLALSPIAWFHSPIAGIPLLVVMWSGGRLNQALVILVAAATAATTTAYSLNWLAFVLLTGLGLVLGGRVPGTEDRDQHPAASGESHTPASG
jgi:Glycosyltransferase family 87